MQLKQSQKDIAELLRSGKQEYARIRVEGVIREKLLLQAYEILELYLELLTVRTALLAKTKELPRDMMEAVSSIIYAAQRISELPELSTLRQLFAAKYGKEYVGEAGSDAAAARWLVNPNLVRCLLVEAPLPEDKLAQLSEIAQEHGVEWDLSAAARDMGLPGAPGSGGGGGAAAIAAPAPAAAAPLPSPPLSNAGSVGSGFVQQVAPHMLTHGPPYGAAAPGPQHYASAQQAAAAAAASAVQARAAADYAAQLAAEMGAAPHGQPPHAHAHVQQQQQGGHGGGNGLGAAAPPPGWLAQQPLQHPAPHSNGSYGPAHGAPAGAAPPGGFVVRSDSDIQRAYDAAPGPPAKGGEGAPAAAPPPPPPPQPPHPEAAPPPPPPPQVEDEYDELTRRLEALKRS